MAARSSTQPYQTSQTGPAASSSTPGTTVPLDPSTVYWRSFAGTDASTRKLYLYLILKWCFYLNTNTSDARKIQIALAEAAALIKPLSEYAMWFVIAIYGQAEKKRITIVSDIASLKIPNLLPWERARLLVHPRLGIAIRFHHKTLVYHESALHGDVKIPNCMPYITHHRQIAKLTSTEKFHLNRALVVLHLIDNIDHEIHYFGHPRLLTHVLHKIRFVVLANLEKFINAKPTTIPSLIPSVIFPPLVFSSNGVSFGIDGIPFPVSMDDRGLMVLSHLSKGGEETDGEFSYTSNYANYIVLRNTSSTIPFEVVDTENRALYSKIFYSYPKDLNKSLIIARVDSFTNLSVLDTIFAQDVTNNTCIYPIKVVDSNNIFFVNPRSLLAYLPTTFQNTQNETYKRIQDLIQTTLCPFDLVEFTKAVGEPSLPVVISPEPSFIEELKNLRVVL